MMQEKRVMFTISDIKIMTAQHVLTAAGIPSFVVNKLDSAHAGVFGDIELYVNESQAEEARAILVEHDVIPVTDVLPIYESQQEDLPMKSVVRVILLAAAMLAVAVLIVLWKYGG